VWQGNTLPKDIAIFATNLKRFFMSTSKNKQTIRNRHEFLKTLFPDQGAYYTVLHMNGFVLVRQFNANNNEWEVAIYTAEAYSKVERWKEHRDRAKSKGDSQK